jgi:uncharacterized FlaG/YvyC family protein
MGRKLIITLDEDTTKRYLSKSTAKTAAELEEACEPSGTDLRIQIDQYSVEVYVGSEEIGEATLEFVDY